MANEEIIKIQVDSSQLDKLESQLQRIKEIQTSLFKTIVKPTIDNPAFKQLEKQFTTLQKNKIDVSKAPLNISVNHSEIDKVNTLLDKMGNKNISIHEKVTKTQSTKAEIPDGVNDQIKNTSKLSSAFNGLGKAAMLPAKAFEQFPKIIGASQKAFGGLRKTISSIFRGVSSIGNVLKNITLFSGKMLGGLALFATGGALGLYAMSRFFAGGVAREYQAKKLTLTPQESYGYEYAGKQMFGDENKILSMLESVNKSRLDFPNEATTWAKFGIGQTEAQTISPDVLLDKIMKKIEGLDLNANPPMRDALASVIGLSLDELKVLSGKGKAEEMKKYIQIGVEKFKDVDEGSIQTLNRTINDLTAGFKAWGIEQLVKIVPPLTEAIKVMQPYIEKLGDKLSTWLSSLTGDDIEAFSKKVTDTLDKTIDILTGIANVLNKAYQFVSGDKSLGEGVQNYAQSNINQNPKGQGYFANFGSNMLGGFGLGMEAVKNIYGVVASTSDLLAPFFSSNFGMEGGLFKKENFDKFKSTNYHPLTPGKKDNESGSGTYIPEAGNNILGAASVKDLTGVSPSNLTAISKNDDVGEKKQVLAQTINIKLNGRQVSSSNIETDFNMMSAGVKTFNVFAPTFGIG